MNMTEFLFVRHGETEMNLQTHIVGGRSNHTPLTERGSRQAALLGEYLRQRSIMPDVVFSSGAVRTNETARIALEYAGLSLPIIEDERLLELGQGEYEGSLKSIAYAPENMQRYGIETMDGKFPGGESVPEVQDRKYLFLDEKHLFHPDNIVLVFGHGLAIRSLAGKIRGFTKQQILAEKTDNASITRIDVIDRTPRVHFVGKTVISE